MSVNTRVLALLKQGTMTSGEIKEALDESFPAVSNALKRLEAKHLVLKLDDKKWGLAANP
jgi:predicted transcriptional regulator